MRIGRLVFSWGPGLGGVQLYRFTPFTPYLWRVFFWRLCVAWLLKTWKEPRKMSRQERRQIERKLRAGKSVVFSNTPGRKR